MPHIVGEMPGIALFTEIKNASLCLPASQGEFVMATKGEISYVFNRARMPNHQGLMESQRQGKLDPRVVPGIGDAFEHKVTLQNLEVFKCKLEDFFSLPIEDVPKRSIMTRFQFFLGIKNEIHITSGA